jgi:hypothetical protein
MCIFRSSISILHYLKGSISSKVLCTSYFIATHEHVFNPWFDYIEHYN